MDLAWWYASRASGVAAAVAMLGAVVGGMSFSARNTGTSVKPTWWLRSHTALAAVAVVSTVIHLVAVYGDGSYGIGLVDLAVPGATPWALSWGVIAAYLLVVGVATSWPRRLFRSRWWRVLHLGLVASTVLVAIHGYQAGTDAPNAWWHLVVVSGAGLLAFVVLVRVLLRLADWYVLRKPARAPTSRLLAMSEPDDAEARACLVDTEANERLAARLASTRGNRREENPQHSRAPRRAVLRSSVAADRARAFALLGATGVMVAVGSWIASVNGSRTGPAGSALGQPPRGADDFSGEPVATPFGSVQVRARFVNGRLIDIAATTVPSSTPLSREISAASVPALRFEALQAQSAEVDAISGASYTSEAYISSLQSAIDQARAVGSTTIR